jgi:ABC-type oligopeptide transport system substrate-binding subunit
MGIVGWSMDFPDPSDFFEPILASDAIQEEETQNFAFFSNPEFDKLLVMAHRELDPMRRSALYRRCEEIVRDQAPWAVGFAQRHLEVSQPYVHGYAIDRTHTQFVRDVWLDEEEKERGQK